MKFTIQTDKGKIKSDFGFAMIQACDFDNWYRDNTEMEYFPFDDYKSCVPMVRCGFVPIGSLEFIMGIIADMGLEIPKPKNIPTVLCRSEFTNRKVFLGTEKEVSCSVFTKSADAFKEVCGVYPEAAPGNYQISKIVDFTSEWRVFVYQDAMVGLKHYSGDFCEFPDVQVIRDMIKAYRNAPVAYTLDVGLIHGKTSIVEVHDFFSCGLYGFDDYKLLPLMFARWWKEYVNKCKKL